MGCLLDDFFVREVTVDRSRGREGMEVGRKEHQRSQERRGDFAVRTESALSRNPLGMIEDVR